MNEEQIKKDPNYFLGGSIVVAAIMIATGLIYSAKVDARGGTGGNADVLSASQPAQQSAARSVPEAPAAPKSSGGCGV